MTVQPQVLGIVLGKPKRGKTSDMLAAFPGALFIGVPGAITLVAQNELGFSPAIYGEPPQTLDDLLNVLQGIDNVQLSEDYGAVVIDDASHLCRRSMLQWEAEAPKGRSGKSVRSSTRSLSTRGFHQPTTATRETLSGSRAVACSAR